MIKPWNTLNAGDDLYYIILDAAKVTEFLENGQMKMEKDRVSGVDHTRNTVVCEQFGDIECMPNEFIEEGGAIAEADDSYLVFATTQEEFKTLLKKALFDEKYLDLNR
jgi:hypothetical protein